MGVKSLRICHRQFCPFNCSLEQSHNIQMPYKLYFFSFCKFHSIYIMLFGFCKTFLSIINLLFIHSKHLHQNILRHSVNIVVYNLALLVLLMLFLFHLSKIVLKHLRKYGPKAIFHHNFFLC